MAKEQALHINGSDTIVLKYLRPAIGAENIDGRFEYIIDNVPMKLDPVTMELIEVDFQEIYHE